MKTYDNGFTPLSDLEITHIASAVVAGDVLAHRLKNPPAGETPKSWFRNEEHSFIRADYYHKKYTKISADSARAAAAQSAGETRLVYGCKSPTQIKKINKKLDALRLSSKMDAVRAHKDDGGKLGCGYDDVFDTPEKLDYKAQLRFQKSHSRSRAVRVMHREWSKQFRVGVFVQPSVCDAPESNVGERFSESLTKRAVSKIFESAAYVAAVRNGFTTFLTLTFTKEQREKLFCANGEVPETIIGKEVSRFLDSAKKVHQRGMKNCYQTDNKGQVLELLEPIDIQANSDEFDYIWVAECPPNKDGEPNPHVHILLRWNVPRPLFRAWAARLEKLWGNGFATLERIKHKDAAGKYIIKAVGYAAKGKNADQGLIRGNRYNIAKCSRALPWECIASFEAEHMGAIIAELKRRLDKNKAPLVSKLIRAKIKTKEYAKALAITKNNKSANPAFIEKKVFKLRGLLSQQDADIKSAKEEIKAIGISASKDHPLLHFDGANAEDKCFGFLAWASGARGFNLHSKNNIDYSDIREVAINEYKSARKSFFDTLLI